MLAEADGWVTKRGDCCGLSPKLRQQQQTRLINNDQFLKQTCEGLWLLKKKEDKSKKNVLISTLLGGGVGFQVSILYSNFQERDVK